MRGLLILAAIMSIAWPANANYAIMGIGAYTCGQFSKQYGDTGGTVEHDYFIWAQGFMSGNNSLMKGDAGQTVDLTAETEDDQRLFLRHYCSDHPLMEFYIAVEALYQQLGPAKPIPPARNSK